MAGLLSNAEISGALAIFESSFDTWSRNITIYKDPLKTEVSPVPSTSDNPFGFGEEQHDPIYTYTVQSGVYPAVIKYFDVDGNMMSNVPLSAEAMIHVYGSIVNIKVKKNCRDFINDGPTERIIIDGKTYLPESDERRQTVLGSDYYVFTLRKTQ